MVARQFSFPDTKISETFLRFAAPLIEPLGSEITRDQFEKSLKLAFTVWNAVVYDAVAGNDRFITSIRDLASGDPMIAALTEALIRRKEVEFGDDGRLIGEYTLRRQNGEWNLWAEARRPSSKD
jgi:hypothetical protein